MIPRFNINDKVFVTSVPGDLFPDYHGTVKQIFAAYPSTDEFLYFVVRDCLGTRHWSHEKNLRLETPGDSNAH